MDAKRASRGPGSPRARSSDASAPSADHAPSALGLRGERALLAGGYLVGERPALLGRDRVLAVVNNQKCTLYECKQGEKIGDCGAHDDMIVSCDSFSYNDTVDLLFTASNDGILKIFAAVAQESGHEDRVLLGTFRVADGGLLCVKAAKSSGALICVYSSGNADAETSVECLTLDYAALLESDIDFDPNEVIPVRTNGAASGGHGHHQCASPANQGEVQGTDKGEGADGEASDVNLANGIVHKGNVGEARKRGITSVTEGKAKASEKGADALEGTGEAECTADLRERFVKQLQSVCTLPSRVDVFAADAELEAVAFAVGKTAMILNIRTKRIVFFECFASISCLAFNDARRFAVGDSRGRITIYSIDPATEAHATDNLVMTCDMPSGMFELSAPRFKKILLAFHSSSAVTRDRSDSGEFHNFRKIAVSVNTLIWHAHGVNCVTFNSDGTMLLSGGEEGVLVVWHLNTGAKKFVTRIGSAIFHILCQREHGWYILCCEANEILFVDPFALCIRSRISGVAVPLNVGMKVNKDVSLVAQPHDSTPAASGAVNADINRANVSLTVGDCPTAPLIAHWPTRLLDSISPAAKGRPPVVGGNVALYSRSNKLQIYNYMLDREVGSLPLKNVNILSRQDDDFGQDWELETLFISDDGKVVVTVQSRNVLVTPAGAEREEPLGLLPEFEHEVLRNNRKGLLKFWVKSAAGAEAEHGLGNYAEQTKVCNPHSHRTTSICQLGGDYSFLTTSLDSEFKLWQVIRKRVVKSDNVFSTYRTMEIGDRDRQVDLDDARSFTWICAAVGTYKNLPCFASSLTASRGLLAISHDIVVTFWKMSANCSAVELVGAVPLVDDSEPALDEEDLRGLGGHHLLQFLYPDQPRLILYSKRSRLCVLDVTAGTTLWAYPLAEGQVVDRVVYSAQLPNLLLVATSTIDIASNECSGALEMFWLELAPGRGLAVERFYEDRREVSRVVLNMCLAPAPLAHGASPLRGEKGAAATPAFASNARTSTLVLLTCNFNLETVLITSDPLRHERPRVQGLQPAAPAGGLAAESAPVKRRKPLLSQPRRADFVGALLSSLRESLRSTAAGPRKRARQNLAEQLCKSTEWHHRVRHPMPKSVLGALVDAGCPTCALPQPNVVLNRLVHLVTVRHLRQRCDTP